MRETKTNVMRILESWHIPYQAHQYEARGPVDGVTVAEHLGISVQKVYKTLVTHDEKGQCYVFVIPCHKELDLKKAAAAVGVKSVSMLAVKDLQRLTGYIRGGCSPIGMKKNYPTVLDQSAAGLADLSSQSNRASGRAFANRAGNAPACKLCFYLSQLNQKKESTEQTLCAFLSLIFHFS